MSGASAFHVKSLSGVTPITGSPGRPLVNQARKT
jgi:hypothetical protein